MEMGGVYYNHREHPKNIWRYTSMKKTHAIVFVMNDGTMKTVYCNFDEISGIMYRAEGTYRKCFLKVNK
jgi:hypothetical protein